MLDDWTESLNFAHVSNDSIAMIDFSKVFNRMEHEKLVEKLSVLGMTPSHDFLQSRVQRVKFHQGIILGLLLWLAYINNLEPKNVTTVKFADDTTIYCSISKDTVHNMNHITTI